MNEIISMAAKAYITPTVEFTPMTNEALKRFADLVRADEREGCARLCENYTGLDSDTVSDILAEAIRARGEE